MRNVALLLHFLFDGWFPLVSFEFMDVVLAVLVVGSLLLCYGY
jgi:hypothetical protein